ncbi:MAG: hypothetical protein GF375_02065 [Candidatus Omnitrophica bacterium]|nr:hypothetical protein [Candidatus Omnitrophota bacterium]MBD3268899.1 hypothetical protein [Candidatus Omnitrophota bacterium]
MRVWKNMDLDDVQKHLIVAGELSSQCYSCNSPGIELTSPSCPSCGVAFKYMGFRRKLTPSFLLKIKEANPGIIFIDFEDFKKALSKRDARKLLDM